MGIIDRAKRFFVGDVDEGTAAHVAPMLPAVRLGGFCMAEAVASIAGGERLVPLLGSEKAAQRELTRLAGDTPEQAVVTGRERLRANPGAAERAVLIYDVFLTLGRTRGDALMMEVVDHAVSAQPMKVAVPYRPASDEGGFVVLRPKFMTATELEPAALRSLGDAFFAGVHAHAQGAKIWAAHAEGQR